MHFLGMCSKQRDYSGFCRFRKASHRQRLLSSLVSLAMTELIIVASSEKAANSTGGYWANMKEDRAASNVYDERGQQQIIEKANQALML